jgi:predicted N-formylglutamate amidohydrolase
MNIHEAFRVHMGDDDSDLLLVVDHASNIVPPDIDLGVGPDLLDHHIAVDIGISELAPRMAEGLGCTAIMAEISRLVVDLHREADNHAAIPHESDGIAIHGNIALDTDSRSERIDRFWHPYHGRVAELVESLNPKMLFTLHSFTPQLATRPGETRPWEVGILYNQDDRAPRIAIPKLRALGLNVGDNEPYSGRELNATMDYHGESRALPYLAIEVRNDLIADEEGARKWADLLIPIVEETRDELS